MVSRNNYQHGLVRQPHYGLRKLGIGVVSVLLSTSVWLGMTGDAQAATNATPDGAQVNGVLGESAAAHQETKEAPAVSSVNAPVSAVPDAVTPTTSIDSQVGQSITVTNHTVTEAPGDRNTGNPGTVTLHLGLTIPATAISHLQNGDYINVKLGLPYTTADGQHEVFSYGAVNGSNQVPLWYGGQIIGYVLPAGNLASYQQSVPGAGATSSDPHWQVVANQNDNVLTNAGSNGYYQIVFNAVLSNYFRNHQGTPGALTFNTDLVWYNPSSNGDKKLLPPSQALVLYAAATNVDHYAPSADLQIGDQYYASGISLRVVKAAEVETVPVATKITCSDHTGALAAHTWVKNGNREYLKLVNPTQSVGISLDNVGTDFTITVTKPAGNAAVKTNFVSAADLQRELQKIIVPVTTGKPAELSDQLAGATGFYLTKQYLYQKPVVTVKRTDNGPDEASYHVTIGGAYAGFLSTNGDGSSPVTLLTWEPTDPVALLPGNNIQSYQQDRQEITYGDRPGHWLGGYSVQSTAVREYLNGHPWHVQVVSQGQTKYDADWGYWIDIHNDLKPVSRAYVDSTYYGFVNQVIYFVDGQGRAMKGPAGEELPAVQRQVTFTSKTGQSGSYQTSDRFTAVQLPVIPGYTAYRGVQSASGQLEVVNGQAATTGAPIHQAGQEAPFEFPHADFVEYVVYKSADQATAHLRFYDDTAHRFIPGMPELTVHGAGNTPITFTVPGSYDLRNYDYAGTYVGDDPRNTARPVSGATLAQLNYGDFATAPHMDQYFIAHFTHRTIPVSGQRTVTETIRYVDTAGRQLLPDHQVQLSFTQTGYRDLVTGAVTSSWSGPQTFPAVISPALAGYLPNLPAVAAVLVSHASADVDRTVVYCPASTPQPVPTPTQRPGYPGMRGGQVPPIIQAARREQPTAHQLPQTGSRSGILAVGLAALAASFGLAGSRRKNN